MPQPLLLEGQQEYVPQQDVNDRIYKLEVRVAELALEFANSVSDLRQMIERIRHGLVVAAGDNITEPVTFPSENNSKWEFWKKRYPGRVAEAIELLLHQREMNISQMCSALRCDPRTLSAKVIYPLNKAGLLNKNGGKFSLKEL